MHFGGYFGWLWEVILDTFSDFAKKGVPHETIAPADEIEVWAPGKVSKKGLKIEEKTVWKHRWKKTIYF